MASGGEETFPAADANNELNPGNNTSVEVDPISSQIAENKEAGKGGEAKGNKGKGKDDPMQTFKKSMIVSGVVIVVVGVAFAISKKLRENKA